MSQSRILKSEEEIIGQLSLDIYQLSSGSLPLVFELTFCLSSKSKDQRPKDQKASIQSRPTVCPPRPCLRRSHLSKRRCRPAAISFRSASSSLQPPPDQCRLQPPARL